MSIDSSIYSKLQFGVQILDRRIRKSFIQLHFVKFHEQKYLKLSNLAKLMSF